MCILEAIYFVCSCPLRDTHRCPHHIFVRTYSDCPHDLGGIEPSPTGFYLRRPVEVQRKSQWEPLSSCKVWHHCDVYKASHTRADGSLPVGCGLELECPQTTIALDGNPFATITYEAGQCEQCIKGHRWSPEPVTPTLFVLESECGGRILLNPDYDDESGSPSSSRSGWSSRSFFKLSRLSSLSSRSSLRSFRRSRDKGDVMEKQSPPGAERETADVLKGIRRWCSGKSWSSGQRGVGTVTQQRGDSQPLLLPVPY